MNKKSDKMIKVIFQKAFLSIATLLAVLFTHSCSSPSPAPKPAAKPSAPSPGKIVYKLSGSAPRNLDLKNLSLKGSISATFDGSSQSGSFKLLIAGVDSISMIISGPLGITVGKLFATSDKFVFYNVFNDEALTGSPTEEGLKRAVNLPLAYSDFVRLARAETPFDPDLYVKQESGGELYKYSGAGFADFASLNETAELGVYQRGQAGSVTIFNANFKDYVWRGARRFPEKLVLSFPGLKAEIVLEIDDAKFNETFDKPFSFNIPKSVKTYKVD